MLLTEAQGELRAEVALHAAARQRAAELEGELGHLRSRVERLDGERGHYASVTDNLRSELKASFEERDTARSECSQLTAEQAALALPLTGVRWQVTDGSSLHHENVSRHTLPTASFRSSSSSS